MRHKTPQWAAIRDLRIGDSNDPEYALTWVGGIALGHDGTIYSLIYHSGLVRACESTGKFKLKFGRPGQGTGEFGSPVTIGWRSDSLYVCDSPNRRFSLFTTDPKGAAATFRSPFQSDAAAFEIHLIPA